MNFSQVLMFNTEVSEPRKPEEKGAGEGDDPNDPANHGKLDDMIRELSTSLWSVKNEQEYMQVRTIIPTFWLFMTKIYVTV